LDVRGREVEVLADRVFLPGRYQATWQGQTKAGDAPPGVYFLRCQWSGKELTKRVVLAG
jgi:hypothetical protein